MTSLSPVLHMVCGKIGSGKSTLALQLAHQPDAVRISEDDWLDALFSDQLADGADYLRCSEKLQTIMAPHIVALLNAGVSVVLDFPANTVKQRNWMRLVLDQSGAAHQMHVLDVPDDICLQRLHARNQEGKHPFAASEGLFRRFADNFEPPNPEEGFTMIHYPHGGA